MPFRRSDRVMFDLLPVAHHAVRKLTEARLQSAELEDMNWLERTEMRSPSLVAEALEAEGFDCAAGELWVLFVDSRCGLIRSQGFGPAATCEPDRTVASILRSATACHAQGMILASGDPTGAVARGPRLQRLTTALHRKGEAIEVFLLDHFLFTPRGCERLAFGRRQGKD